MFRSHHAQIAANLFSVKNVVNLNFRNQMTQQGHQIDWSQTRSSDVQSGNEHVIKIAHSWDMIQAYIVASCNDTNICVILLLPYGNMSNVNY